MKEISENSSRLGCEYDTQDPYNEKPEFSRVEEVVISEYNSDDLYQRSEFSTNDEDSGDDDD